MEMFRVWVGACSHVHSDLMFGRRSLAEAFEQSEFGGSEGGPPFDWNIMLHLGDISGTQTPPTDEDGPPVLEQFRVLKKHRQEDVYCLIIACAHHVLRDTTTASGRNEGVSGGYHKRFVDESGASYLYWVGDDTDTNIFHDYFDAHPGVIDLWLAGHTHTHPDDRHGGKELIARRWNVTFANCAALTRYHGDKLLFPMSRLFTFTKGSNKARLQCYLHTSHYAPQGWYQRAEREVPLRYPFMP